MAAVAISPWGLLEASQCLSLACGSRFGEQRSCGYGPETAWVSWVPGPFVLENLCLVRGCICVTNASAKPFECLYMSNNILLWVC
ncbi:hypothetical protein QYF61_013926 [Mycteria americana]|uniref:Uncharacterized protein n=1 Tax=Mycteria americana TaxID=33587 RepID=A0AAN7RSM7_MYCAM|nr:hypothetical protein QYF61_013926 [Mycteria americana]